MKDTIIERNGAGAAPAFLAHTERFQIFRQARADTSAVVCAMGEKLILRVSIAFTKVCSSSKASAVSVQTISQAMTEPSERQRRSRFADRTPKVPSAPKMSIRTEESTAVITVWRDGDAP